MTDTQAAQPPKLTGPQQALLAKIVAAGEEGMIVPGTLGSTAKVLRQHLLVEEVVSTPGAKPRTHRQRATDAGRAWRAPR